jgi:hypothetical protein
MLPHRTPAAFLRTLSLLLQPRHPAAKLTQFLAFGGGQPSAAVAIVRVASAQPVAKRLLGNAQLLGHFADTLAAGADQPDRLSAELQRIGGRVLGTWTPLRGSVVPSVEMSTRPDRINSSPRPTLFGGPWGRRWAPVDTSVKPTLRTDRTRRTTTHPVVARDAEIEPMLAFLPARPPSGSSDVSRMMLPSPPNALSSRSPGWNTLTSAL